MCCRNSRRISVESTYEATFMNSLENRPQAGTQAGGELRVLSRSKN